jgi:hypothetical protein
MPEETADTKDSFGKTKGGEKLPLELKVEKVIVCITMTFFILSQSSLKLDMTPAQRGFNKIQYRCRSPP